MAQPILTFGPMTGSIYIVTRYKVLPNNHIESQTKYDVTEQFDALIEQRQAHRAEAENLRGRQHGTR